MPWTPPKNCSTKGEGFGLKFFGGEVVEGKKILFHVDSSFYRHWLWHSWFFYPTNQDMRPQSFLSRAQLVRCSSCLVAPIQLSDPDPLQILGQQFNYRGFFFTLPKLQAPESQAAALHASTDPRRRRTQERWRHALVIPWLSYVAGEKERFQAPLNSVK